MLKTKRMRVNFLYTLALIITFFFVSPSQMAYAYFSDVATESLGLKLTLGNIDLEAIEVESSTNIVANENIATTFSEVTLKNAGSLYGKLGYKIEVVGLPEGSNYKIQINNTDALINKSEFQKLDESFYKPNDVKNIEFQVIADKLPAQATKLKIKITFLMVQTNSELNEPMFFDKETIEVDVEIKALPKEEPTTPNGWPEKDDLRWKNQENGLIRYLTENMDAQKENYFGYNKLDDTVSIITTPTIFVELKEGIQFEEVTGQWGAYRMERTILGKGRYRIQFFLDKSTARDYLAFSQYMQFNINYKKNNQEKSFSVGPDYHVNSKRTILSSDIKKTEGWDGYDFTERNINLSSSEKSKSIQVQTVTGLSKTEPYMISGKYKNYANIPEGFKINVSFEPNNKSTPVFTANTTDSKINVSVNENEANKLTENYETTMIVEISKNNQEKIYIRRKVTYTVPQKGSSQTLLLQAKQPIKQMKEESLPETKLGASVLEEKVPSINELPILESQEELPVVEEPVAPKDDSPQLEEHIPTLEIQRQEDPLETEVSEATIEESKEEITVGITIEEKITEPAIPPTE